MKIAPQLTARVWLSFGLWVGVAVLASIIAAVGSFENLTFVYQGL